MNKRTVIGLISAGVLLLSVIGASSQSAKLDTVQTGNAPTATTNIPEKVIPTCDGTSVTASCTLDGASYKTYIYHPAVAEKTHTETITTYREKITGYCTLCNDGTYSPSCATGRGACSHHDGVAQWNAARSSKVAVDSIKTIVDVPAKAAYYEKE